MLEELNMISFVNFDNLHFGFGDKYTIILGLCKPCKKYATKR